MANTLLTPSVIAKESLALLRSNAVMGNLVHRDYSGEFAKVGDTITVRKPATFTANEYNGSTITVQDATESGVTVKMNKLLDVSFAVTSKEMSLSIEDFSEQLLKPAMCAFADKVDKYLLGLEANITNRVAHSSGDIAVADIVSARKNLVDGKAPLTDRYLVVGSQAEADLLNNSQFTSAEKVGDEGTALREASLGRKYGLDIYVDQNIESKTTYSYAVHSGALAEGTTYYEYVNGEYVATEDSSRQSGKTYYTRTSNTYVPSVAFHKNAFALVTRPLEVPQGAAKCSIENFDGFSLRVVYGYDMNTKTDTISIDMLCGVAVLDRNLASVIADAR